MPPCRPGLRLKNVHVHTCPSSRADIDRCKASDGPLPAPRPEQTLLYQIGYCTPSVGTNLFLASHRFDKDILVIYRSTLPFLGWLLVALLIITWWPGLSLWLAGRD